jgi:cell division protein FtsQ
VRRFWILLVALAVATAAGCYALVTAPQLRAENVVVSGAAVVPRSEILAHAAIDPDANVWLLPTHAIEARVRAIPLIDEAKIVRSLPNGVEIAVTERSASACLQTPAGTATIDPARRVLRAGCADGNLPRLTLTARPSLVPGAFVTDGRLEAMQADDERIEHAGLHVAQLEDDPFGGLDATLRDGLVVQFGSDDDLATKLPLVQPVLDSVAKQRARIAAIDVRAPGTPVIRYR